MENLTSLWHSTGIYNFTSGQAFMMLVGFLLLYLAIKKGFEPLLLLPIGFGAILSNIPIAGIAEEGGLLYYLYFGIKLGLFPLLIFMGVGAMTDFGPMLANPKTLLLGATAQVGIFAALLGALALNAIPGLEFSLKEAAAIGIIGGWTNSHLCRIETRTRFIRRDCCCRLLVHGVGAIDSTTNYASIDDRGGA